MLKAFCDVCKKPIEDDAFSDKDGIVIPLNGTGADLRLVIGTWRGDLHVHTRCVFDSIRAAERRLNEAPAKEAR